LKKKEQVLLEERESWVLVISY